MNSNQSIGTQCWGVKPVIEIDLTKVSIDLSNSGETSDESISIN